MRERLIIFASGSKTGGGSGFEKLVEASNEGILDAEITAVISNHENGGVRERADRLHIPFVHFPAPWTAERYQEITQKLTFDFISLSGWLKLVTGLDPRITFNIHPGPLPDFGGPGMHGHHVHEAVFQAYRADKISCSAVSMHFIRDELGLPPAEREELKAKLALASSPEEISRILRKLFDKGPVFFHMPVEIYSEDSADTIGKMVNRVEHHWQSRITNLVVQGQISWDGKDPASLRVPEGYKFLPPKK